MKAMSVRRTIILFLILLLLTACGEKKTETKIYVSCYPLEYFTKLVMRDAQVDSIIPVGVDPHEFEPSIKDIQRLYNSKAVIYFGDTDIDRWLDRIRDDLKNRGVKVLRIQDKISLKKYNSTDELDPHIWLDPIMSLQILELLRDFSLELNPHRKSEHEKTFNEYKQKLTELDSIYKAALSQCTKKDVIGSHEFLNYLSSRYGFKSHFIVHKPEQEVSLKKIKQLKDFMNKYSITYIIAEPEGEKIAKALSEETKAKILKFDTFHRNTGKDYVKAMKENLISLKIALDCK